MKLNQLFTKTWDSRLPGWSAAKLLLLGTIFTQDEIYPRKPFSQQHNAAYDASLWSEDPAFVTGSLISILSHLDAQGVPDDSKMGKTVRQEKTVGHHRHCFAKRHGFREVSRWRFRGWLRERTDARWCLEANVHAQSGRDA